MSVFTDIHLMCKELSEVVSRDLFIPKIVGYPLWLVVFIIVFVVIFIKFLLSGIINVVRKTIPSRG